LTGRLSAIRAVTPDLVASAELVVDGRGEGFTEITHEIAQFVQDSGAGEGAVLLFLRHTSASLVIQENADPDVQADLITALRRLAPADGPLEGVPWVHTVEGPDDMPGHIKTMLTGVSLHVPVQGGALKLGTWQGIYLVEHRARPHRREVMLQFVGTRSG
jgi:secondary thiamine-phosphate synthase enzyme